MITSELLTCLHLHFHHQWTECTLQFLASCTAAVLLNSCSKWHHHFLDQQNQPMTGRLPEVNAVIYNNTNEQIKLH